MRISKNKPCKFRLALIISLTAIAVLCSIDKQPHFLGEEIEIGN